MSFIDDYNMPTDNFRTGDNFSVRFPYGVINYKTGREPLLVANSYLGGLSGILSTVNHFTQEGVMSDETADKFIDLAERMSLIVARLFEEPLMVMAGQVIAEAGDPLIDQAFRERGFEGRVVLNDRPLRVSRNVSEEVEAKAGEFGIKNPKSHLLLVTSGGLLKHLAITPHGARFTWNVFNDRDGTLLNSLALTPSAYRTNSRYDAQPNLGGVLNQFEHFDIEVAQIMKPASLAHQILIDYIVEQHRK